MLPRLAELEVDLRHRRERAQTEGWLGEVEGIDLTLRLLPSLQRACVSNQPDWLRHVFIDLASINLKWLAAALGLSLPVPDQHTPG